MPRSKKRNIYFRSLDLLRIFFCVSILLYHLDIIKGGYLAVCSFFVLSGYLSCTSAWKNDKFSFKDYYKNRLLKIYLPLIATVFISLGAISYIKDISLINMKNEVLSILGGYNNYFQIHNNADYFAQHINSPFVHMWYMGVFLQFELVFPFIFVLVKTLGDKVNKKVPIIVTILSAILSSGLFVWLYYKHNIMGAYYGTLARCAPLFVGIALAIIQKYYSNLIPKKLSNFWSSKMVIAIYVAILTITFLFVSSDCKLFLPAMLFVPTITARLIDYCTSLKQKEIKVIDSLFKVIANSTYEIYLLQYPIIFIFEYITINNKYIIMISILIILSSFISYAVSSVKKAKVINYIAKVILLIATIFGIYRFTTIKDHVDEMKQLEEQLAQNEDLMLKKQEEFENQYQKKKEELEKLLNELEQDESKLKDAINMFHVVGVGDSVMLGTLPDLYEMFPNGYFDAKISRTAWVINDIFIDLKDKDKLGEPIIIGVGANGDCTEECKEKILNTLGDREIFWVNASNDKKVHVNDNLKKFADKHDNVHIVDWYGISVNHNEYFVADGVHLTNDGIKAYTDAIFDSIYDVYSEEYRNKKEEAIKNHENEYANKITFYGNETLLNAFNVVVDNFKDDKFMINKDYSYELLNKEITDSIADKKITKKVVLALDKNSNITKEEYQNIITLLKDNELYIVILDEDTNNMLKDIEESNVTYINFYEELKKDYLMSDEVHLNNDGINALNDILLENLCGSQK